MKKIFKMIGIFLLVFVIFLYFIGSCTERPEYKPKEENTTLVYTELTPDEYQRQMDDLINNPPLTKTSFKSPILQAHASSAEETYEKFIDNSPFYNLEYYLKDGWNIMKDFFSGNESYPVDPVEPKEIITVPFEYNFYGKNRVVYKSGAYEIITCNIISTGAVSDKSKTGAVKYTRINNLNQMTQFSFDISIYKITQSFSSSFGFLVEFYGLDSYMSGLTSDFIEKYLKSAHRAYFQASSVNSLKQYNISSNNAVTIDKICYNGSSDSLPNHFSISTVVSNDYEFSQSLNNYYIELKLWKLPNIYYNNHAGDVITKNNIINYNKYGYTYNDISGSIEFNPDIYADFFDLNIKPKLEAEFDLIFSKFPDIDVTYSDDDTDIDYTNLIQIIKELQTPETTTTTLITGTYPVVTGDINVNVDVTFPAEFYKTYPPLNTEPAFIAENPDVDFALDSPLPVRVLEVSGGFISLASDFLYDVGLMPIALLCVSLGFVVMVFL